MLKKIFYRGGSRRKFCLKLLFACPLAFWFSRRFGASLASADEPPTEEKSPTEENIEFNKIDFEREINYTRLYEERPWWSVKASGSRQESLNYIVRFLWKNDYEGAIKTLRSRIDERLKNDVPWNVPWNPTDRLRLYMRNAGLGLNRDFQALAICLELNGDYEECVVIYSLVFGTDPETLGWIDARVAYEWRRREPLPGLDVTESVFHSVVKLIQDFHDLTPTNVDNVIRKVRETEKAFAEGKASSLCYTGIPVMFDSLERRDQEAVELYRLRDWCARIVCPKLHFIYLGLYDDMPRDGERIKLIETTRKSYEEFVDLMEEEYSKLKSSNHYLVSLENFRGRRALDAMTLLRKMKELPY